ncbi:flagellar hook protein FlgE [Methylobacter psychrophilus]|uniref:flagellar hook protein FlgE n=1 Tax=Methylobacter psychrophilus TaxID=96941 RepID=UPI0021D500C5|nr:flagellar hook protein FlgE [Methylobacter psychrophilus]
MSFIDITGMNLAQQRLDVISNNIANANTVGFKSSTFNQTLAAMSFASSGAEKGGAVQAFSQGTISASGSPFNLAINGAGLFQLDNNGIKTYTRDGQFSLNKAGEVVDATGDILTGYKAVDGVIQTNNGAVPLIFASEASKPVATTTATLGLTLNSMSKSMGTVAAVAGVAAVVATPAVIAVTAVTADPNAIPPIAGVTGVTGVAAVAATPAVAAVTGFTRPAFDSTDPTTYTSATTSNIYDSLGAPHTIETFYTKLAVDGAGAATWDVKATVDGGAAVTSVGTLIFNASGALDVTSTATSGTITVNNQAVSLDLSKSVQYATSFGATNSQNGFPSGQMTSYSVSMDGVISVLYSTGNSAVVGQVALATFKNLNGLASAPNNQWSATSKSGNASVGTAGSTALGLGLLSSSAIEDSNVNLVNEMVNMISAQRAFQAQSSVIKTEDQNLQTIVGLKQ